MDIATCLTPYKWKKPVLVGSGAKGAFDSHAVDCPFVFRHNDHFYMMYVGFDGTGYQTAGIRAILQAHGFCVTMICMVLAI
jgi:hypothetical protein